MTPEQIEIVESAAMHVQQTHMEGVAPGTEGMSPFDWLDTDEIAETIIALQAEIDRLRDQISNEWQPIETAPIDVPVLLFCPDRGCQSNPERIELGVAHSSSGSHHSWATHWRLPPDPPTVKEAGNGQQL